MRIIVALVIGISPLFICLPFRDRFVEYDVYFMVTAVGQGDAYRTSELTFCDESVLDFNLLKFLGGIRKA
jgi:hypothetical protein